MQTKIAGIALIVIGILIIMYTEFNYVTTEKLVDLGPIQFNQEKNHPIRWLPVVGAVVLVGGIMVIVFTKRHLNYHKAK